MRVADSSLLFGIIVLLVIAQASRFSPLAHINSGNFTLTASGVYAKSIDGTSANIVVIQYSAESAAVEFFVIHSDYYDLAGLPDVSLCQFHTVAQSASCQFTLDRDGTWYLVFANSPQTQEVTFEWNEYSAAEWNFAQFRNWSIVVICVVVASILIFRYARSRVEAKS